MHSMKAASLSVVIACFSIPFVESWRQDGPCGWYRVVTARSIMFDQCMTVYRRHCSCSSMIGCSTFEYKIERVGFDVSCSPIFVWCPWEAWSPSELMQRSSKCFHYSERRRRCCLKRQNRRVPVPKSYLKCQVCGDCTARARQILTTCPHNVTNLRPAPTHVTTIRISSMAVAVSLVIAAIFGAWIFMVYRRRVHQLCTRARSPTTATPSARFGDLTENSPPTYDEAVTSMLSPPSYEEVILTVNLPTAKAAQQRLHVGSPQDGNASI